MGAAIDVTTEKFRETVERKGIVLIDWWAPWCGPCLSFAPTYEEVATANPDVVFAKINTQEQEELAGALQIRAIPTLMAFRDGVLLFREAGALPRAALEELVKKVRELDMDEVRREIDKQKAAQEPQG